MDHSNATPLSNSGTYGFVCSVLLALALTACGGSGSGGSSAPSSTVPVTGTLSAPGGALALNAPGGFRRVLALIFGGNAIAALPGATGVPGVPVKLIEIDSAGNQVGADIASATTAADGSFILNAPANFVPGSRFVIRASGGASLDRLVSDLASQDVDPASHTTKLLVLGQLQAAGGDIQNLQRFQVEEVENRVADMVSDVDSTGLTTAGSLVSALSLEAPNDEELSNSVGNLTATGGISGTVTDSAGVPLANIKIVLRDFNQWVTRAETRTDNAGRYALKLASGDYIAGAVNFTASSMAASEWWTCNDLPAGPVCGAADQFDAAKVTVGTGSITLDFKLEPGTRIQGGITSAAVSAPLPGVQVAIRDFISDQPVAFQRARLDGSFRVNVRPGIYTVGARNTTLLPFAGGLYNGPAGGGDALGGGGANSTEATPMTLAAGNTYTVNFPLVEGGVVRGLVTDGATPTPNLMTGIPVRFYDSTDSFVEAVRTNRIGGYRLWVRPGDYIVRARGQTATPTVAAFSATPNPSPVQFGAAVGRVTATLHAPGGTPLSQVKVRVYDTTVNNNFQGQENSNGDGSVEVYAQPDGNYLIEYKVDNGSTAVGTAIHDGTAAPTQVRLLQGASAAFSAATPVALGSITLPAGGELKGIVTKGGAPAGNIVVQARSVALGGANRFTSTRTMSDGSYSISVPAGTYSRVCAFVAGTSAACPAGTPVLANTYASADAVQVVAGQSNVLDIAIP